MILNSKGFGGNNASALVLSPQQTMDMLLKKHGAAMIKTYHGLNTSIHQNADDRDQNTCEGNERIIYRFGEAVMDHTSVAMTPTSMTLSEFKHPIHLPSVKTYKGYL